MCKQNKLEMAGQKKKFQRPPLILEPYSTHQFGFKMDDVLVMFWCGSKCFCICENQKKRCQVVNKTWLVSLKEAVDLVIQADSESGS